jgi:hypothetical protein
MFTPYRLKKTVYMTRDMYIQNNHSITYIQNGPPDESVSFSIERVLFNGKVVVFALQV